MPPPYCSARPPFACTHAHTLSMLGRERSVYTKGAVTEGGGELRTSAKLPLIIDCLMLTLAPPYARMPPPAHRLQEPAYPLMILSPVRWTTTSPATRSTRMLPWPSSATVPATSARSVTFRSIFSVALSAYSPGCSVIVWELSMRNASSSSVMEATRREPGENGGAGGE